MAVEDKPSLIALDKSSLATYTMARENSILIEVQVPHWRDALIVSRGAAIISYSSFSAHDSGFMSISLERNQAAVVDWWEDDK